MVSIIAPSSKKKPALAAPLLITSAPVSPMPNEAAASPPPW